MKEIDCKKTKNLTVLDAILTVEALNRVVKSIIITFFFNPVVTLAVSAEVENKIILTIQEIVYVKSTLDSIQSFVCLQLKR